MEQIEEVVRPGIAKRLVIAAMTAMPMTLMCLASCVSYAQLMVQDTHGILSANFVAAANFCSVANAIWTANAVSFTAITMTSPDMTIILFLKHILHTIGNSEYDLAPEEQLPTMVVALHVGSALLGFSFFLLGRVRMAVALNYLPYPVTAGFLAMVGAAVVKSSFALLQPVGDQSSLPLIIGCILAGIAFVLKQFGVPTNLTSVVSITVSLVAFHVWVAYTGHTQDELRAMGWLFPGKVEPVAPLSIWQIDLQNVNWRHVFPDAEALTLVFVACINRALVISGIESASGGLPYSIDAEMQNQGLMTVLVGSVCGTAMNPSVGLTSLCKEGAAGDSWVARATAWLMAGTLLVVWASGVPLPNYLPRFLLGGLLMMMGAGMLFDWAWTVRRRMKLAGRAVIYGMVIFSFFQGLIPGVVLGITLTVFVVNVRFAQLDVLKYHVSGVHYRAGEVLTSSQRAVLREHGKKTQVIGVTGYLFEGVAIALCRYLREVIRSADHLETLVLDCGACQGINSSACMHIMKVVHLCAAQEVLLKICDLSPEVCELLREWGADTDWCEVGGRVQEALLGAEKETLERHDEALEEARPKSRDGIPEKDALSTWLGAEAAEEIFAVARLVSVKPGIALVREGELPPHMYIAVPEFSDVCCELRTGTGDRAANLYRTTHGAICAPEVLCGVHSRGSWIASSHSMCFEVKSDKFGLLERSLPLLLAAGFRQKTALMDQLSALYTISRGGGWKGVAFDESTRFGDLASGPSAARPPRGCKECLASVLPFLQPKLQQDKFGILPSVNADRRGSSTALFASGGPDAQRAKLDLPLSLTSVDPEPLLLKHEKTTPSGNGMVQSPSGSHLISGLLPTANDDEWLEPGSPLKPSPSGFASGMKKSSSGNHLVSGLLPTANDDEWLHEPGSPLKPSPSGFASGMKKSSSGNHLVSGVLPTADEDDDDRFGSSLLATAVPPMSLIAEANLVLNRRSLGDGHSSAHSALQTLGLPQRRGPKRPGLSELFKDSASPSSGGDGVGGVLKPVFEPSCTNWPQSAGKENLQGPHRLATKCWESPEAIDAQSVPVSSVSVRRSRRPTGAVEQPMISQRVSSKGESVSAMIIRPLMTGDENPLDVQFRTDVKRAASPEESQLLFLRMTSAP